MSIDTYFRKFQYKLQKFSIQASENFNSKFEIKFHMQNRVPTISKKMFSIILNFLVEHVVGVEDFNSIGKTKMVYLPSVIVANYLFFGFNSLLK